MPRNYFDEVRMTPTNSFGNQVNQFANWAAATEHRYADPIDAMRARVAMQYGPEAVSRLNPNKILQNQFRSTRLGQAAFETQGQNDTRLGPWRINLGGGTEDKYHPKQAAQYLAQQITKLTDMGLDRDSATHAISRAIDANLDERYSAQPSTATGAPGLRYKKDYSRLGDMSETDIENDPQKAMRKGFALKKLYGDTYQGKLEHYATPKRVAEGYINDVLVPQVDQQFNFLSDITDRLGAWERKEIRGKNPTYGYTGYIRKQLGIPDGVPITQQTMMEGLQIAFQPAAIENRLIDQIIDQAKENESSKKLFENLRMTGRHKANDPLLEVLINLSQGGTTYKPTQSSGMSQREKNKSTLDYLGV